MFKCQLRLMHIYGQMSDDEAEQAAKRENVRLAQEMELFCNFCGQRLGVKDQPLFALPCSHFFHQKCALIFLNKKNQLNVFRFLRCVTKELAAGRGNNCIKCETAKNEK